MPGRNRIVQAGCAELPECLDDDVEVTEALGHVGDHLLVPIAVRGVEGDRRDLGRPERQCIDVDRLGVTDGQDHPAQ